MLGEAFILVAVSGGSSPVVVGGLLTAVTSLAVEHRFYARRLQSLRLGVSVVVNHGLSCSQACAVFLGPGLNHVPCIDKQILIHCASPGLFVSRLGGFSGWWSYLVFPCPAALQIQGAPLVALLH